MILTGSSEFFTQKTSISDFDYIVFCSQDEVFKYVRDKSKNTCYFQYRESLTKVEYFDWLEHKNSWYLNFAPLVNKEFLARLGINMFNEDREVVYRQLRKAFSTYYRNPNSCFWNKYLYRIYIYYRYMQNRSLTLSKSELREALRIKKRRYNKEVMRGLYAFFGFGKPFDALTKRIYFKS